MRTAAEGGRFSPSTSVSTRRQFIEDSGEASVMGCLLLRLKTEAIHKSVRLMQRRFTKHSYNDDIFRRKEKS